MTETPPTIAASPGVLPPPYYEDREHGITLYHGDARLILPLLTEPVDLVICDPPYGLRKKHVAWDCADDVWDFDETVTNECARLLTPTGIFLLFFWARFLLLALHATRAIPFRSLFIWHNINNCVRGDLGFSKYTPALVLSHGSAWRNMQDLRTVPISTSKLRPKDHPTAKPLALMIYIVRKAARPGQTVLDPCCGSGTVLLAAKRLGRRAIGIEINKDYCDLAVERLAQERLPFPEPPDEPTQLQLDAETTE